MSKVAVIFAGCGYIDGAEVQESVSTLIALEQERIEAELFAPDMDQVHVVNHLNGEEQSSERRNVLIESARITRGNILPLVDLHPKNYAGLVLPGGFGVAKNLSDYFYKGDKMKVDPIFAGILKDFQTARKPIAALCISPIVLAKVFGDSHPTLTLGAAGGAANHAEGFGAKHQIADFTEVVLDEKNRLITSPCYMLESTPLKTFQGTSAVIAAFKKML